MSTSTSCCRSSVTTAIGFVDLATYEQLESYLYGGPTALTYFVRSVKKANWFTHVPISLRICGGKPGFGQEFSASVNRSGDYVLNVWLSLELPAVALNTSANTADAIRWTHNFMHNLVEKCWITFNELTVHELYSSYFDFHHYLTTPASKRAAYETMIGEVSAMTEFKTKSQGAVGVNGILTLPIPLFFCQDSGLALPIAALPFNDVKLNFCLRDWRDLMVVSPNSVNNRETVLGFVRLVSDTAKEPQINCVQVFAHYAVVHNDERVLMGKAPRDMVVRQHQYLPEQSYAVGITSTDLKQNSYDLRFSHAIEFLMWGSKNKNVPGELSNYAVLEAGGNPDHVNLNGDSPSSGTDIYYENSLRASMASNYYQTIVPWYFSRVCPDVTGINSFSYTLEMFGLDPKGSTNYSKLANVSIVDTSSAAAGNYVNENPTATAYRFCLVAQNLNVLRVSGGSMGLPIL
jgi:hypothetical protein